MNRQSIIFWITIIALAVIVPLFFHQVRLYYWGSWQWFKGVRLGKRAETYSDTRRIGQELDAGFGNIKTTVTGWIMKAIAKWTAGAQASLLRRLGTLRRQRDDIIARQAELEQQLQDERRNPPRERPRIKGLPYYTLAFLLAVADVAITFMCLQALNYPVIMLVPTAILLGAIGFFSGDYLGKNIEPAQRNPNPEKNRLAIILLGSFSLMYVVVFGTMRFLYTQKDPSVSLALNLFGSYGFIAVIVGCSVMLGWLHEGITTEEKLGSVKARRARIEIALDRCDKQGAKMTEAFRAHLVRLQTDADVVRSRYRGGFNSSFTGRAPYGVEPHDYPLDIDEDILKSLTWPDPPTSSVSMKPRPQKKADLSRYEEPLPPSPAGAGPVAPNVASTARQVQQPAASRRLASNDGPPAIG